MWEITIPVALLQGTKRIKILGMVFLWTSAMLISDQLLRFDPWAYQLLFASDIPRKDLEYQKLSVIRVITPTECFSTVLYPLVCVIFPYYLRPLVIKRCITIFLGIMFKIIVCYYYPLGQKHLHAMNCSYNLTTTSQDYEIVLILALRRWYNKWYGMEMVILYNNQG